MRQLLIATVTSRLIGLRYKHTRIIGVALDAGWNFLVNGYLKGFIYKLNDQQVLVT